MTRKRWGRKRVNSNEKLYNKPRIDPALRPIFRRIGVPEPKPFKPDPFQLQALEAIKESDVLVTAPTGSGKTWIAIQSIHDYLAMGLRVWYASPLKALSNSIYQEFSGEFGSHLCGIITGDRKENPEAPIIVGTTEILRNQLYDSMVEGTSIRTDLVVMDEAHYLSDPDRGVVWEEVLIYLPSRVKLLMLSATISNPDEIAHWLQEIRGQEIKVVRAYERPVPLEMLFLFPDGLIAPLAGKRGLSPRVKKFLSLQPRRWSRKRERIDFGAIIQVMRKLELLPAIFFLKSRADCDRALLTCPPVNVPQNQKAALIREVEGFLRQYPHLRGHRQLQYLLESLVAAHHGGQLPYWKVLIEKLMNKGYLEAIFSTSTVAAGVNFPARTVVLVQSDRYNGREFVELTATELHQMTGRAGRRGKDHIGFVLIIPGLHQDPQLICQLKDSPPEPLKSQIHINFSMTLNLLLSHTPDEIKDLLERSFAAYQQKHSGSHLKKHWEQLLVSLKEILPEAKCDTSDPYEVLQLVQAYSDIRKEIRRLKEKLREERLLAAMGPYLTPGRLFYHRNRDLWLILDVEGREEGLLCSGVSVKKARASKKGIRGRIVRLSQIKTLLDYRLEITEESPSQEIIRILKGLDTDRLAPLKIELGADGQASQELRDMAKRLEQFPCEQCPHNRTCHRRKKGPLKKLLGEFFSLAPQIEIMEGGLWLSFRRHLRFLKETGFVDQSHKLTPDGIWASKLRLDQPLLIAEAIRKGAFEDITPELLAGGIAPFVWDRVQEAELKVRPGLQLEELEALFEKLVQSIGPLRSLKIRRGFETPPIMFWPCVALFLWAKNVPWEEVLSIVPVDEGDMASLIMRSADHLRQITNLATTHPTLAETATRAIELILREPVYIE